MVPFGRPGGKKQTAPALVSNFYLSWVRIVSAPWNARGDLPELLLK
jgi:hypothetical protein